jgi:hypothetical protein
MSKLLVSTSGALAIVLIAFSSCGKGVSTDGSAGNGSANGNPPTTTTPPGGPGGTITPTPGPSTIAGCPANQLISFDFAQGNPPQTTINLNLSGLSAILFVSVGGQEVSYTFDSNAGSITLSDAGQPGETIHIDVCLPSPIGKPTGKPI